MRFSSVSRSVISEQLSSGNYDLLVIGGGITGAGIALDAAARGLKVALVEMQDFASGTSSRSTKLIHGGLRYLKQLEFKLVAEVGRERKIVHRNAPHLTRPEKMLLPIVKGGALGKLTSRIAMRIYEWLADVKKEERHIYFSAEQTQAEEPLLRKENLIGSILFYEYKTDDARLTIEVLKEAVDRGALALNYLKVISFIYKGSVISGVRVSDQLSGNEFEIKASYCVNASGPWVDAVDDLDKKHLPHKLQITKGIHLVIDRKKLPVKESLYFDTHDKRMIFVIPHGEKLYIGTTDTFYNGDLLHPEITGADRDYLLRCVNEYFQGAEIVADDIESGWAGLRPLVSKPGRNPSEISRKDEVFISGSGLITIAGGKLTGYRKMAQRVTNKVSENIRLKERRNIPESNTENIQLSGGKIPERKSFAEFIKSKLAECAEAGIGERDALCLIMRYGSNTDLLLKIFTGEKKFESALPVILKAELVYSMEHEMCLSPADFFIRRTGALYFDPEFVKHWKNAVTEFMAYHLSYNTGLKQKFSNDLHRALAEVEKISVK
jgi:glycerol-3-phosphate dehydrogenase